MTFTQTKEMKNCFVACSKDKVNKGLCDCINRVQTEEELTRNINNI